MKCCLNILVTQVHIQLAAATAVATATPPPMNNLSEWSVQGPFRGAPSLQPLKTDDTKPIASFCEPSPTWPRDFEEDFSGAKLNTSRWTVYEHNKGGQCGFGVGRYGKCEAGNVYLDGKGSLVIKTDRKSSCSAAEGCFNYTSGGVITRGKVDWSVSGGAGYRLCVRAILPGGGAAGAGAGIWPAHWMMPEAVQDYPVKGAMCDPDGGEIDVLEMVNGNAQACGTYHWQTSEYNNARSFAASLCPDQALLSQPGQNKIARCLLGTNLFTSVLHFQLTGGQPSTNLRSSTPKTIWRL